MLRRTLIKGLVSSAFACPPALVSLANPAPLASYSHQAIYIPGYAPDSAYLDGYSLLDHPTVSRAIPKNYGGPVRLLTRLAANGDVVQALFPVGGHDVDIRPDGNLGIFGSMEHGSYVAFDPVTLDLISIGNAVMPDWVGGGHSAFFGDGALVAVTERAPKTSYKGSPEKHFGRITIREPDTLKIVEDFSVHGISPHDVQLMEDGEHVAVANYGSTVPKGSTDYGVPRHIVEPSVTVLELKTGKLVDKITTGSSEMELRHLCANSPDRIFAIQTEMAERWEARFIERDNQAAFEDDQSSVKNASYIPAPTVKLDRHENEWIDLGLEENLQHLMRPGLSIVYDEIYDEVIVTYPASHSILVFDGETGAVKNHIQCSRQGLDYPCGVVLLPDGNHYAVTGYWKNMFIYERGNHKLIRDLCHYTLFFGHSHITAV